MKFVNRDGSQDESSNGHDSLQSEGLREERSGQRSLHTSAEVGSPSATPRTPSATPRNGRNGTRQPSAEELLARFGRRRSVALRNRLVELHRSQVESMARSLAARLPRSVDVNDLVHAGIWGLMRAIDNFDSGRGGEFLPFMRPRVRGAMLDELRTMDFLPRLYRQRIRERETALARLRGTLDREPCDSELAAELGVSENRLHRSYGNLPETNRRTAEDSALERVESLADEAESPIDALNRQDLLEVIEQSLTPIEWTVLKMHYLEGKSGKEVAQELNLSASRICQIHVRVLSRLKSRLASLPV